MFMGILSAKTRSEQNRHIQVNAISIKEVINRLKLANYNGNCSGIQTSDNVVDMYRTEDVNSQSKPLNGIFIKGV